MKVTNVKQMALPALGIGAGMFASPKVSAAHPTLAKYPEIAPVILLIVAIALLGVKKARGFAIGLGAVALVFLVMALWGRVGAKAGVTEAEVKTDIYGRRLVKDIYGKWGLPDIYSDPYGEGI